MEIKVDNASLEQIVQNELKVGVAKILSEKSDLLIERIVQDALNRKKDNWARETIIDGLVRDMIIKAAKECIAEWIEEKRPEIKKAVSAQLSRGSAALIKKVTEGMVANLKLDPIVDVYFKRPDR